MSHDTALVTGGAGFIGSAITRDLVAEGMDVVVVDNLSNGSEENVPDEAIFVEGDLSDQAVLDRLSDYDIDVVHHLAGQSSNEKSFDDPEYDLESHVLSTFNLLRWCQANNVDRLLYASTMSVYGDPDYLPVDEEHPVDPKTYYAAGKIGAEAYVKLYDNLGMDTTIFRLFTIYGPGQNMANMKQGMVSIYLSFVLRGEDLIIKGPMDRFRDFVYVDDVVDAWTAAAEAPATYGETYNVARNECVKVRELVDTILECYGTPDYPVEVTDGTPGDQHGIYGDASKLRTDLGWEPEVSLKRGIDEMIAAEEE